MSSNEAVDLKPAPSMGAEDFPICCRRSRVATFGRATRYCRSTSSKYDFNDETIAVGASYWARLVEKRLPKSP